jgi:hypothetical protein
MFMCVVNLKSVNKLDLTWKQSFVIDTVINYNPNHVFSAGLWILDTRSLDSSIYDHDNVYGTGHIRTPNQEIIKGEVSLYG